MLRDKVPVPSRSESSSNEVKWHQDIQFWPHTNFVKHTNDPQIPYPSFERLHLFQPTYSLTGDRGSPGADDDRAVPE